MRNVFKYVAIPIASYMMMSFSTFAQQRSYDIKTIGKHEDEVLGVFVNGDNTRFATSSLDESIKIW